MDLFQAIAFEEVMRYAIALVVLFGAMAAILYTLWGGFLMILSGGVEDKVKSAVNHIRHAIIGVGFLLCVLFIVPVLMRLVGLPYGEYVQPQAVFSTIAEISGKVFGQDTGGFSPSSPDVLPENFSDL